MSTVKVSHGTTATRTPPPPLPFHLQFVAGAAAGIFEVLMMYPLDGKNRRIRKFRSTVAITVAAMQYCNEY